jgi:hypothetical protein
MTLFLFSGGFVLFQVAEAIPLLLPSSVSIESAGCVMSQFVTAGVIVERVGDDLVVIVPGNTDVVSLSGRPANVLLDVKAGRKVDSADPALRDLVDLGILSAPGFSRRGLVKAGVVGAGAGIAVLAMPGVAAASSAPRTQLIGYFSRMPGSNYFQIASFNGYILGESGVADYLTQKGAPTTLPVLPDPFPSNDPDDILTLDVPEFGLFNLSPSAGNRLTPGNTYIEWTPASGVDLSGREFATVGYFSWAGQDFEVFFFDR